MGHYGRYWPLMALDGSLWPLLAVIAHLAVNNRVREPLTVPYGINDRVRVAGSRLLLTGAGSRLAP